MSEWKNRIVDTGTRPASEYIANPKNWRTHPMNQRAAVEGSLNELGWIDTVIVNRRTGYLIDGHERLWQALKAGEDTPVPFIEVDLSEEEEALALASLDPITNQANADREKLNELLQEIQTEDAGLQEMLSELAESEGLQFGDEEELPEDVEPQISKAEELREKWGVESGQLWQLGDHRLICGDCTDLSNVHNFMNGEQAAITFTSPPYNLGVSAQLSNNTHIGDNLYKDEYDDNQSQESYKDFLRKATNVCMAISDYTFINIQMLAGNKLSLVSYLYYFKDKLADIAIWDKKHAAPQQAQRVMDSRFEFILIFSDQANRAIGTREFRGMVHNVYDGLPQRKNEFADSHAGSFPVDFPEHFIKTFTNKDELIFDPFLGTGTTLIACERLHRKCRAIEISPAYVAVAIQRWVDVTGGEPELLSD